MRGRSSGYILPVILYLLTVLSAIALASFELSKRASSTSVTRKHSADALQKVTYQSLEKLSLIAPASYKLGLNCESSNLTFGVSGFLRNLCFILNPLDAGLVSQKLIDKYSLPPGKLFPSFDFNKIFSQESPCAKVPHNTGTESTFGFTLSPAAAVSSQTCLSTTSSSSQISVFKANLALNQNFSFSGTLAASGYMDLRGQLSLAGPSLFISGGDMYIESLQSTVVPAPALSVISASGVVHINNLDKNLHLKIISWSGAFIGGPSQDQASAYLPQLSELRVVGLINDANS